MVGDDGHVVAVLDWEICTLGDPLADLGLLQVYWTGPDDAASAWTGSATTRRGLPRTGPSSPPATPRSAGATSRSCRSTCRSPTGSWPASSRACTPATSAARSGQRDAAELEPFKLQVDGAAARRSSRLGAARDDDAEPLRPARAMPRRSTSPVLVVMLTGWIDASGAAAAAMAALDAAVRHARRWPRSTATRSSTTAPAARPWSCATASTPRLVWPDIELKVGTRRRRARPATAHRPRARLAVATRSPARSPQLAMRARRGIRWSRSAPIRSPRRTPGRRACRAARRRPTSIANVPYLKNSVDVPAGMSAVLEHALTEAGHRRARASGRRCPTTSAR